YARVTEQLGNYSSHSGPSRSISNTGGKKAPPAPPKLEECKREELGSKQRGWKCGDVALGIERGDVVKWMQDNSADPEVRALLAPEIRTEMMMTALIMNQNDGELLDKEDKQQRLKELLEINDALGGKEDTEVRQQIDHLLKG